ncbi:MAG: hypothetical protein A2283_07755 [Lentisphaerae bacterium RIFOXYA12_FULL_48_11]|nr:MAG: hypothetical protein A2283_07755 [Lentisphaerae bacterium RIFOXYA12_FULL_48_11]
MSKHEVKLNGWQALAGIVALAGIFGFRLMTFSDKTGDKALMREIEIQLKSGYFPEEVKKLKAVYETGDKNQMANAVESITSARLNIESVQASSPLFEFSTSKEVVVKVSYTLKDASGTGDRKTSYYLFHHGSIGNVWTYKYKTSSLRYYLNFL